MSDMSMDWPGIPDDLEPLTPNPGGTGDPESLVGRERELARLHEAVVAGGAHVTGERRMGKTWLIKRLQADLAETVSAIYVSAETSSLDLFGERLVAAMRDHRLLGRHIERWEKELGGKLTVRLGVLEFALHGKATKSAPDTAGSVDIDLLELLEAAGDRPVVLIVDEITHLCHALGAERAGEFLSALRSSRQSGGPPLVICGSIGLHHALDDFAAVNDLWTVTVGPLAPQEAVTLTSRLLLGIGAQPTRELVESVVEETSAIPFYIHAVVDRMRYRDDPDVAAVVSECLADNTWHTDHYVTRLEEYYGRERAAHARAILDLIAQSDMPLRVDALRDQLASRDPDLSLSRDDVLVLLDKLERDHYLVRDGEADRMSSALLGRIWRHHRRLT